MVPETGRKFLPQGLAPETYVRMFEVLLWCEEFKISYVSSISAPTPNSKAYRQDLERFDMQDARIEHRNSYYLSVFSLLNEVRR